MVLSQEPYTKHTNKEKNLAKAEAHLALFNNVYNAKTTVLAGVTPEVVADTTNVEAAPANVITAEEVAAAEKALAEIEAANPPAKRVSSYWLIITYLILTFAELFLSPMGISFVSKVAPPKYKGMMMGGWFVATAIGNFLVAIPALMWGASLTVVWGVLTGICLLAAFFVFAILKRLEKVAK